MPLPGPVGVRGAERASSIVARAGKFFLGEVMLRSFVVAVIAGCLGSSGTARGSA